VWSRGHRVHFPLRGDTTTQQHENAAKEGTREGMCVLVANEPLAYREVVSAALRELRPRIRVHTAEPAELERASATYSTAGNMQQDYDASRARGSRLGRALPRAHFPSGRQLGWREERV
jgi:hypothetical protein